jgi:dTDP-4-dehydrorhamnose reductase
VRILILGKNGQVGWELQRSLAVVGEVVALGRSDRQPCGDLLDADGLSRTLRDIQPDVIVNAAGYTMVDQAESEPEQAMRVNAAAVGVLASGAAAIDALLVHYSTDYVFNDSGTEYLRETDPVDPCNAYGVSKAEGDRLIGEAGCRHLIFRTSWVYAVRGQNFLRTMLRLATERDTLRVVNDQWGAPTGAELIADVTARVVPIARESAGLSGVYHLAPAGETNWCAYAGYLIEEAAALGLRTRVRPDTIEGIATSDYPTAARRPVNSRLDTSQLRRTFDVAMPDWRSGVSRAVSEIMNR